MSSGKCSNWLKDFDNTGVEISFSLPTGSRSHKTTLGGCGGLILIIVIIALTLAEFEKVFISLSWTFKQEINYLNQAYNGDSYTVPLSDFIPAVLIFNSAQSIENFDNYF